MVPWQGRPCLRATNAAGSAVEQDVTEAPGEWRGQRLRIYRSIEHMAYARNEWNCPSAFATTQRREEQWRDERERESRVALGETGPVIRSKAPSMTNPNVWRWQLKAIGCAM